MNEEKLRTLLYDLQREKDLETAHEMILDYTAESLPDVGGANVKFKEESLQLQTNLEELSIL